MRARHGGIGARVSSARATRRLRAASKSATRPVYRDHSLTQNPRSLSCGAAPPSLVRLDFAPRELRHSYTSGSTPAGTPRPALFHCLKFPHLRPRSKMVIVDITLLSRRSSGVRQPPSSPPLVAHLTPHIHSPPQRRQRTDDVIGPQRARRLAASSIPLHSTPRPPASRPSPFLSPQRRPFPPELARVYIIRKTFSWIRISYFQV
ncbi:hypothetical protein B0H17DRAFT_1339097 [Mycena rosella]|uniref:Uncharacterized protein n=1 Tax=Mycena rosella TaxID=1033263 RepID=A0AAD7FVL1_MYCRO|nr:hypothetical protein B0H17DRAFT_1339097 [Mycena rosella]